MGVKPGQEEGMKGWPAEVEILEVGPRDGLQNRRAVLETAQKIGLIGRLAASGLSAIQLGAFVSPRAVPQFADVQEVARTVTAAHPGVGFSALVPNRKGAADALACGVRELSFVLSVTESHNVRNVNKKIGESLAELVAIMDLAAGHREARVTADLATSFGCPYEGKVPPERVLTLVGEAHRLGVRRITLCDTVGYGNPRQVGELARRCHEAFPDTLFRCHLHNTRGLALANTLAALEAGVRSFDASVGGLGGCPFAPGATGNVATEDLVFMLLEMGVETGVDLPRLLETAAYLGQILPAAALESSLSRAGLPGANAAFCPPDGKGYWR
jgi:hydroxymethylglutaryl-CoA lyase